MQRSVIRACLLLVASLALSAAADDAAWTQNWPQWRGPLGTGVAPAGNPPVEWGEQKNVRWKAEIPGLGLSSPIVWGDRIFLTTAIQTDKAVAPEVVAEAEKDLPDWRRESGVPPAFVVQFVVLAIDRRDGHVVWQRTVRETAPHEGTHSDGSWAAASAVTDGKILIAHFGSFGTYAMDLDGTPKWEVDLGDMQTRRGFGEGSSPALHGDTVVINWDQEGPSFLAALDRADGKVRWKVERDEVTSWSTPVIVEVDGKAQVVVSATGRSRGYDLSSGKLLWELAGMTTNAIPTPLVQDGVAYVMSGYRGNMLQAIRLAGAAGDLAGTKHVVWQYEQDTPYVPSGVLYDGQIYFMKHFSSILSALDAKDGSVAFARERLDGIDGVYSSLVAADGRVYVVGRAGTSYVLAHGEKLKVLARNELDDHFDASPAIVGGDLLLRGRARLYCLSATKPVASGPGN